MGPGVRIDPARAREVDEELTEGRHRLTERGGLPGGGR